MSSSTLSGSGSVSGLENIENTLQSLNKIIEAVIDQAVTLFNGVVIKISTLNNCQLYCYQKVPVVSEEKMPWPVVLSLLLTLRKSSGNQLILVCSLRPSRTLTHRHRNYLSTRRSTNYITTSYLLHNVTDGHHIILHSV